MKRFTDDAAALPAASVALAAGGSGTPASYDLVSFDLDGTLVDTAAEIAEAANRALESHGFERRPVAEITLLIGAGLRELMLKLLARCFLERPELAQTVQPDAVLHSVDAHYAVTTGTMAVPYSGCRETLEGLKAARVMLACVTNKEIRHARRVLEVTDLQGYFDLVVGGDSLPEKKPHASVLQYAMATLGSNAARTAHVGDSAIDVAAARNAGVAAWAVPYGYNAGVPITDAKPDLMFHSLPLVAAHVLAGRPAARSAG
jgi:phosphoglycolate phosphatase